VGDAGENVDKDRRNESFLVVQASLTGPGSMGSLRRKRSSCRARSTGAAVR